MNAQNEDYQMHIPNVHFRDKISGFSRDFVPKMYIWNMDLIIFILSVHIDTLAGKWYVSDSITVTVVYGHCIRIQSTKNLQKSADISSENHPNTHEWRICEGTGDSNPQGHPGTS